MADPIVLGVVTAAIARELAADQHVCVRPLMRTVYDRDTRSETVVAIACGSTRDTVCPSCAHKAKVVRMQQCAEGWHRTDEPEHQPTDTDHADDEDQDDDAAEDTGEGLPDLDGQDSGGDRRVRSTRRRQDAPELPRVPMEDRTIGRIFRTPDGREYRPSMFLTLTLPSYGKIDHGVPVDPDSYNYRRAALDALHFPKLVDRFWQNLRRTAGYKVQYFAAVEPQTRLAPHLHAAIRGAIPRKILRQAVAASYAQVWWPAFDQVRYPDDRRPVWTDAGYCDPDTGELLQTWDEALDDLDGDPDARPVHTMRFGSQVDVAGIIAPSPDADRAVRYLTKYLTKAIADPVSAEQADRAREAHIDRLHHELRYLPCSPRCANWLRYGIQPAQASVGLIPGRCLSKAHDREHLGCGGRRVLVSRNWTSKTLAEHRADRATVVRQALESAGIAGPDVERIAADVTGADGRPRYIWSDAKPDPASYTRVILASIAERQRWKAQYAAARQAVDSHSATGPPAAA